MQSTQTRRITHCIFDMDGLLLDTEKVYTELAQSMMRRYGSEFTPELKVRIMGRPAKEAARILIEAGKLPITVEELLGQRDIIIADYMRNCTAMPGAEALISRLQDMGIQKAIATSSFRNLFEVKTSTHQSWISKFQAVITGDHPELKHGKPAPDIFLLAAKALGAQPENCLVFEDAPAGIQAAQAAGMATVFVPDPLLRHLVADQTVDLRLDSLLDFPWDHWHIAPRTSCRPG
ncbi:MAG: HAD-IA family hydrolase [Pseudomonadota bacterium]